jgi:hypothetical protein
MPGIDYQKQGCRQIVVKETLHWRQWNMMSSRHCRQRNASIIKALGDMGKWVSSECRQDFPLLTTVVPPPIGGHKCRQGRSGGVGGWKKTPHRSPRYWPQCVSPLAGCRRHCIRAWDKAEDGNWPAPGQACCQAPCNPPPPARQSRRSPAIQDKGSPVCTPAVYLTLIYLRISRICNSRTMSNCYWPASASPPLVGPGQHAPRRPRRALWAYAVPANPAIPSELQPALWAYAVPLPAQTPNLRKPRQ